MSRVNFSFSGVLVGLAALLAPVADSSAQQPMAFVHGFQNDGSAWSPTATYLSSRFSIQPVLPTLVWSDRFSDQELRLNSAIAGYSGLPALAHSNGGLASRYHSQLRGSASGINRLATIGTPHGGAFLATRALGGWIGAWGQDIVGAIGDPMYFYSTYDPDWWWAAPLGLRWAAYNMQRFGNFIPFGVASGVGIGAGFPVTFDLRPGDTFLSGLNSSQGLGVESSVLNARVGISTVTRPQNMMTRMVVSNWQSWTYVRWSLWSFAIAMRAYYSFHPDWYLAANAWRWEHMALRMMDLDVVWHWQIGALESANCSAYWCFATVFPSDGLSRASNQAYPSGTRQRSISNVDIIHIQQKNASASRNVFERVLDEDFFVPRATSPPPGPSFPVSVDGPTQIRPGATCTWNAAVSGGTAPYSYNWTNDGMPVGNEYYYTGSKNVGSTGSSFRVRLSVTDATGATGEHEVTVFENSSAPICLI